MVQYDTSPWPVRDVSSLFSIQTLALALSRDGAVRSSSLTILVPDRLYRYNGFSHACRISRVVSLAGGVHVLSIQSFPKG